MERVNMRFPTQNIWIAFLCLACARSPVLAVGTAGVDLQVGHKAPTFIANDHEGNLWNSADHVGKKVLVVYFYPADMTPGCTKQACGFRDDLSAFFGQAVTVVGISGDSVQNHRLFQTAYKLGFPLVSDPAGTVAASFGVPTRAGGSIEREFGGEKKTLTRGTTAARWTFVVGLDGNIAFKNTEVTPEKDSQAVLEVIRNLRKAAGTADNVNLQIGDEAPTFEALADNGETWKSTDHVGKKNVVVYFYPADMTGGCTRQACNFRDQMGELQAVDTIVVGVSGDSVANHQIFRQVHGLNFPLLADPDGAVARKFGVPLRKGGSIKRDVDGKTVTLVRGVTASRWTFIIDKNGKISSIAKNANADKDSERVLQAVGKK